MILRKKCLHGIKTSERGNKKKVISEFYGEQNFKGILLFDLIRRSLEFFANAKNRDDFFGFDLSRLMRGITTSRVSPLLVMTILRLANFLRMVLWILRFAGAPLRMTIQKNRLVMTDEKEAAGILGSCVASPRMTVEKGYCHLEPRAIARGCKDLINKCRDCIELTRLKQVRIKLKRDLYGDFACAQPLKMTMIICFVLSLGVVSESWAACVGATATTAGTDEENQPCGSWDCGAAGSNVTCTLSKGTLTISGEGEMRDYVEKWATSDNTIYPRNYISNTPWSGKKVQKVVVGDDISKIGRAAFVGETYLTEVSGTTNIAYIGAYAFNRTSITSIDIPKADLGAYALHRASNLQYMNLKNDIKIDYRGAYDPFTAVPAAASACIVNEQTGTKTCGTCNGYVKAGTGCVTAENCGDRYYLKESTKQCLYCPYGKVVYKEECLDEYPFAKKHYTPAEAAQWLNEDDNTITLTFKK